MNQSEKNQTPSAISKITFESRYVGHPFHELHYVGVARP